MSLQRASSRRGAQDWESEQVSGSCKRVRVRGSRARPSIESRDSISTAGAGLRAQAEDGPFSTLSSDGSTQLLSGFAAVNFQYEVLSQQPEMISRISQHRLVARKSEGNRFSAHSDARAIAEVKQRSKKTVPDMRMCQNFS